MTSRLASARRSNNTNNNDRARVKPYFTHRHFGSEHCIHQHEPELSKASGPVRYIAMLRADRRKKKKKILIIMIIIIIMISIIIMLVLLIIILIL